MTPEERVDAAFDTLRDYLQKAVETMPSPDWVEMDDDRHFALEDVLRLNLLEKADEFQQLLLDGLMLLVSQDAEAVAWLLGEDED